MARRCVDVIEPWQRAVEPRNERILGTTHSMRICRSTKKSRLNPVPDFPLSAASRRDEQPKRSSCVRYREPSSPGQVGWVPRMPFYPTSAKREPGLGEPFEGISADTSSVPDHRPLLTA